MRIRTSGLAPSHRLDYAAIVRDLLKRLPPEHTAGLDYVTISGDPPLDDDEDVLGQYYERFENEPPGIVLYLSTMEREAPRFLKRYALTWKILLAQTLYHEVGHHYQHFTHGIAKGRQEDHAESYGDRWSRAAFPRAYGWIDRFDRVRSVWNRVMIAALEVKARVRPTARTFYRLGRRCENREDHRRAMEHWVRALEIDPGFEPARKAMPAVRTRLAREAKRVQLDALVPLSAIAGRPRRRPGRNKGRRRGARRR